MKKIVVFFLFLCVLTATNVAQDTISSNTPKESYFVERWADNDTVVFFSECWIRGDFDERAYSFYTPDSMQVFGLTVSLSFEDYEGPNVVCIDTTMDSVYCKLRLYKRSGNTMQILGESIVHMRDTPISYYLKMQKWNCLGWGDGSLETVPVIPVYELFFDHPVTVVDTFYLGFTYLGTSSYDYDNQIITYPYKYDYSVNGFYNHPSEVLKDPMILGLHSTDNNPDTPWWFNPTYYPEDGSYFLYAIIAPPFGDTVTTGYLVLHSGNTVVVNPGDILVIGGDTLVNTGDTLVVNLGDTIVLGGGTFVVNSGDTLFVNPGDTLFVGPDGSVTVNPGGTFVVGSGSGSGDDPGVGVRQTDMVYRYTTVSPNPATERATVTSSFGLERIEVYDSQGRQTLTLPATGYRATLDTRSWPSGTYLLRITTPLGTTTKKLLVR